MEKVPAGSRCYCITKNQCCCRSEHKGGTISVFSWSFKVYLKKWKQTNKTWTHENQYHQITFLQTTDRFASCNVMRFSGYGNHLNIEMIYRAVTPREVTNWKSTTHWVAGKTVIGGVSWGHGFPSISSTPSSFHAAVCTYRAKKVMQISFLQSEEMLHESWAVRTANSAESVQKRSNSSWDVSLKP